MYGIDKTTLLYWRAL